MAFEWNDSSAEEAKKAVKSFEPLPAGKYRAIIAGVEDKETKAGNGKLIKFEFLIVGGFYDGRKYFENCNYQNPNPQAVQIGYQTLLNIGKALGFEGKYDPMDCLDKMLILDLGIREDKRTGNKVNSVKKYMPDADSLNAKPVQKFAPQQTQASDDSDCPF
jgi:hypothetical protein